MTLEIVGGRRGLPARAPKSARWTRLCTGGSVTFGHLVGDDYRTPRVWGGHGLGLPETDLAGFAVQLAKVMKHHAYWVARAENPDHAMHWSPGRYDDEDAFVYFAGPCTHGDRLPGYHPAAAFTIALPHVRGLRIRVAAYLAAL
ncbi:hypothetical protein VA596_11345 [Amycolatopsis sp., V23-08]|uniref:Uncharacterized protein n=1 Tax=Amycolatopsis heterodermiae TaxID=3110235 RepID=A0ABU5R1R9_9PSEU|nr:hypothetical protein [Amycolatopsis sp., V23-08]MEA5360133.1 hypothetical protein [Amycolatopsis sp., V23-08]